MSRAVLVTGLGVVCAAGSGAAAFAAALRSGRSQVTDDGSGALAAPVRDFSLPDAVTALGGLPSAVRDRAVRAAGRAPLPLQAALTAALQAWDSAGLVAGAPPSDQIGVVVGGHNLGGQYAEESRPRFAASPAYLPGRYALRYLDTDHVGTVSEVLGLAGEGFTVGGASASGNAAIISGARLVAAGDADVCLVIGALTRLSAMERQAFVNLGAMAPAAPGSEPASRCRPFDTNHCGFVPGEGAACLVLESARSARNRGATPWALVAGYALRLDGNSQANPNAAGEAAVMSEALRRAGVPAGQVDYVNTHGTGSRLGDETELAALRTVFGDDFGRPWLNATKGLTGHCLCAAGVVEAVATLIQLREGFVHPNVNLDRPIDAAARFAGSSPEPAGLRVALSNGFGFGGINTSVVFTGAAA
jgi:malonyl-ACP decarboxylase